ncbi:MAG: NAD(P)/FAD-dependent oxidoreductase, partial [Chloroflexi bacterium]|nr:NAD(P)/FAD-dependent oxidoreductase [Chloroflexota bacterium]
VMDYDVIIAGGSFAGLVAAAQLRGKRVLLVEPHAIGAVQTSACGTLLAVLEAMGTTESLLQVHDRCVLHLRHHTIEYPLPYPFCTFDYRTFCNRLLAQSDAEILHASVLGHRGHEVFTTRGAFDAEILIDATGWRAALATNSQQQTQRHNGKSFGLETTVPVSENGLHFYYDPHRLRPFTAAWLFPIGACSRVGLASYLGHTELNDTLTDFICTEYGGSPDGRHGGYFPYRRRPATTDHVIRVGDAAGQCIPLTGEGIRPALYFGAAAGRLARRVLAGEMREVDALRRYRGLVERHMEPYRYLLAAQNIFPRLPEDWIERLADSLQRRNRMNRLLHWYWNAVSPTALALGWSGDAVPMRLLIQSQPVRSFASPGNAN